MAYHCDHSYCNIFRAIGKPLHDKKHYEQINKNEVIRRRLGIGVAHVKVECVLFKMENNESDINFFNSWFPLYKISEFDELHYNFSY